MRTQTPFSRRRGEDAEGKGWGGRKEVTKVLLETTPAKKLDQTSYGLNAGTAG